MTKEQKILSLLAQFKELGIDQQIDYNKFYLHRNRKPTFIRRGYQRKRSFND